MEKIKMPDFKKAFETFKNQINTHTQKIDFSTRTKESIEYDKEIKKSLTIPQSLYHERMTI